MTKKALVLGTLSVLFSTTLVGCTSNLDSSPPTDVKEVTKVKPEAIPLEVWEQKAIAFVEAASIHKDETKASRLWKSESNDLTSTIELYTVKAGKVKVASHRNGADSWLVYLFVPYPQSENGSVLEVSLGQKDQNIYVYDYAYEVDSIYSSFEELQTSRYWEEEGRRWEWKDAELH
ncbi:hypothetical protein [Shimazuella kribbensis]|uniref:hypothetical protein n=1 Tax=Shimazuella kribbensis TaxID=139808 RepID=UPI0003FA9A00|nr:hypothetical protein [Shimazuella kribbensis]